MMIVVTQCQDVGASSHAQFWGCNWEANAWPTPPLKFDTRPDNSEAQ